MKKEKKETAEQKHSAKITLAKEYPGMSLSDIYHYENIKLTKPERSNAK